ncbi:hypothetical protein CFN78_28105 [Amycolatopsis antarctica]|uniref:Uncharacterized protein n=1 Tax=Amycolatopsis antarctica TaxID=1854586 RepID=A0A263CUV1_9PSEU|nr:hypothetical protein CFN78_28105 [Amycolatopsis antarctica]
MPDLCEELARLRTECARLERIARTARTDRLDFFLDRDDDAAAAAEEAAMEARIEVLQARAAEIVAQIEQPHPLWPGGWVIHLPDEELHFGFKWIDPDFVRRQGWHDVPTAPGRIPAWRTREDAEQALAAMRAHDHLPPGPARVEWHAAHPDGIAIDDADLGLRFGASALDAQMWAAFDHAEYQDHGDRTG